MKHHFWPVVILIIFALIGVKALFHAGWYTSHDGEHQLVRQYVFDRAVKAGHIPPRVDRQLLNGLGYPLFTFTYQMPFIIGEPLRWMGVATQDTVKLVFVLAYIASGLTMYAFAQELWGKKAGLLAGGLYLWAPYRFSVMFVRASLGEHVALAFVPLVLWSLNYKFLTRKRVVAGALSFAGLVLSHVMATQIFLPVIILSGTSQLIRAKNKLLLATRYMLMAILALGLASYYLLPALIHRADVQGLNRHFYAEHFVTLKQLVYSPWGYTFSQVGTANDGMSFQVGLAQWLVIGVALVALAVNFEFIAAALILSFLVAMGMMLDASSGIWNSLVKNYWVVDIPWRFLAVAIFASAALAGFVITRLKSVVRITVVVGLVILAVYNNRNYLRVNKYIDYPDSQLAAYRGTSNSYDEYQSVFVSQALLKRQNLPEAEVVSGSADITVNRSAPDQLLVTVQAQTETQVQLNTIYFPGWTLTVDGQSQNIKSVLSDGVPRVKLGPGNYLIGLIYRQTPAMVVGNMISLMTIGVLLILWLKHPKLS
ncbi:MAG: hypothetical protein A2784_04695 [Candidatus Chisholmbacteria bacterium RIFCSPHIGHO2_01_FULL_48_12]|uniref:Membrane protein 6-pyruvoyl-tetrahydropterin synthase-related domain-containing protein n=1 Tax=Candidatus Chisholmbacteria bacterium RIFCSPHIGHO2_01_FULL_48_12 TaxID=1797589 RepID=A0A1G1VN37_9BACT|nr:MAG: hypothetical protein A2784_04695 [Candidatus Chisholmbacteria bacterium RIFCSPHIGHO2_01_FULL_48_12]